MEVGEKLKTKVEKRSSGEIGVGTLKARNNSITNNFVNHGV